VQTTVGQRDSSLLMLRSACNALQAGDCDVALINAAQLLDNSSQILSLAVPSDQCCEGATSLVLKRLEDVKDSDKVLCILDNIISKVNNELETACSMGRSVDNYLTERNFDRESVDGISSITGNWGKDDINLIIGSRRSPMYLAVIERLFGEMFTVNFEQLRFYK
jgi:acetyl-CoA acetyltransferase